MTTVTTTSKPTELSKFLGQLKSQIELALPQHMSADRMCRLALTQFSNNPKLQKCTFHSIAACVMLSSQTGLEIGVNGQAYMIPYGDTATFVPGWKGMIDLVNRYGKASVWTGAVFDGDEFDWALGDKPYVVHRPMGESDPEKLMFAYAIGRPKGSEYPIIECWPNQRILAHRDKYNKVGKQHYSFQHWEMYARKIVLLQVLKYLPQSVELSTAIQAEYDADENKNVVVNGTAKTITTLDQLTDRIEQRSQDQESEQEQLPTEEPAQDTLGQKVFTELMDGLKACKTEKDREKLQERAEANWNEFTKEQSDELMKAISATAERVG